jgi:hypothetical protein
VLVFFSNKKDLLEFEAKAKLSPEIKNNLQLILEDTKNKDFAIKTATFRSKVSFLIREYGRGTDFISLENKDQKGGFTGGVVVI